jgi:hypothetical protein
MAAINDNQDLTAMLKNRIKPGWLIVRLIWSKISNRWRGSGPENRSGKAAKTNGRLSSERSISCLIFNRDRMIPAAIIVKNKIYAGHVPLGDRLTQRINTRVKIVFTLVLA